jgi:WS/DGAT/MGAT family acyltransferase
VFEDAIYEVPLMRRRLVEVPGNMDFPYWIEDPDFDIEFHVRHVALPQPGDWRQFYIQVARLHSRPLDMQRPLWEIYVVEGLNHLEGIPANSFGVLQKLHHAAVDGASVRKLFMAMHDFEAMPPAPKSRRDTALIRESKPRNLPLLLKSYQRSLGRPSKLSKAVLKSIRSMRKLNEAGKKGEIGEAPEAPKTRFNGEVSPHRVVTSTHFNVDEFKRLRRAVPGATINDLAICILGGALRLYLQDKKEDVDAALVVQIPVDIRQESQLDEEGNQITTINASSGSNIIDPLERLEMVSKSTTSGKKRLEVMGESMMKELADALGPHVTKVIFTAMENAPKVQALSNLMPSGPNFAFSNMPGPPVPVYLCGAEVKWGIGLGPLMPNMGLFITGTSSLGKFVFGINACRSMMPDPEFFQECLQRSYEETRTALQKQADENNPFRKSAGKGIAGKKKAKTSSKTKSRSRK